MAIDPMISNAMLDPFRNMLKDVESKGLENSDVEVMREKLARMDQLAAEMDDINQFNATLMTEDLFNKFSQAYGAALSGAAKADQEEKGYDDSTLLQQTLDGYRDAVKRLKEGKEAAMQEAGSKDITQDTSVEVDVLFKEEALIKPIEEAIKLGESGISLPEFLRLMIEKGMDKAMEGTGVTREGMEYLLGWAKASMVSPHHIAKREKILAGYDALIEKAPFGVPDSLEATLMEAKIDHEFVPPIAKWDAVQDTWERVLGSIDHWIISHCSFAPHIEPWSMAKDPYQAVIRTQETEPGKFKVYEKLLQEYHGISWDDIFDNETFLYEIEAKRLSYSKERIAFLREQVYTHCRPGNKPPQDVITEAERMRAEKLEYNPELGKAVRRTAEFYDSVFGEGRFKKKYGIPDLIDSNAQPW